jgi:hypothetical protein
MTMFNNCYTYNPPHFGIVGMAKGLEQLFLTKMANMPEDVSETFLLSLQDFESIFMNCYQFNQNEDDVTLMCRNLENLYREKIKHIPTEVDRVV